MRIKLSGIRIRDLRDHRMRLLLRCGVRDAQAVYKTAAVLRAHALVGA